MFHNNEGSVLVNDFWTPLPPPNNFVHDQISFYLALFELGYDTYWAERCG